MPLSIPRTIYGEPVQAFAPGSTAPLSFGASAARAALPLDSSLVRLSASQPCFVAFGDSSVNADGTSMYFPAGAEVFAIPAGASHLSAVQVTTGGIITITGGTLCKT